MSHQKLREQLRRQPFQPFRLYLSGGQSYVVAGPEWMIVTRRTTALGLPGASGDGERVMLLDNLHITHTEPVDAETGV
jgi:hypothetical protein